MSLSYVLALTEYSPHVGCKYTSNFTHHSITNLKLVTIFYDCCVCGLCCNCGLNSETAITRNATAPIVETMYEFNRKIGLPDLGPVYMEKSCPGQEGHPSSLVNFTELLYEKKVDPSARAKI